jgi:hypothetical protein
MTNKMATTKQQTSNILKFPQGGDKVLVLHTLLDMLIQADKYRRENGLDTHADVLQAAIISVMDEAHRQQQQL